jgi:hypothetical protein
MIVPDRVVQAERLVSVAPTVAWAFILFDYDGRYIEEPETCAKRDTALATADDHYIGLLFIAKFGSLACSAFSICLAVSESTMGDPSVTGRAFVFLMSFNLLCRREERPTAVIL